MIIQSKVNHFHGKPKPIRPPRHLPIRAHHLVVLSFGLLALSLASVLVYFIATGYHIGDLRLLTEQTQKWHWLTQIAIPSFILSMLTMAAAIFLFAYITGKSEENRTMAKAHRRYRQLRSRRRRSRAATRHNATQNQETAP